MRRVLLIPSDHGGGKGHVSRCLYLAELLYKNDYKSAVVLESKHYKSIINEKIKTYLLNINGERFIKYQLKKTV